MKDYKKYIFDFQKKTDGTVNILGEVATAEVSAWLVEMSQVASLFTLFTHHAKTTENLIAYMRNALLKKGGFKNEAVALEQVIDSISFDIHMKKNIDGHRYIERITEIVPVKNFAENNGSEKLFETRDIIQWKEGCYIKGKPISENTRSKMIEYFTEEERKEFEDVMTQWEERC